MKTLWQFTRPHTIIGSAISVTALYLMSVRSWEFSELFWYALSSALFCNIFITGYNQLVDIELDKLNKPELPLPSGKMSPVTALVIVFFSITASLALAAFASLKLLALIAVISLLGFVYSWKGIYLKKHHQTAALAIVVVRGVLVNLGFYTVFTDNYNFPSELWVLTLFVVLFSAGIAWFKDIPDMKGDEREKIDSLALRKGAKKAFSAGFWLLGMAYVIAAFSPFFTKFEFAKGGVVSIGHALLGGIFVLLASRTDPLLKKEMKRFYLSFWGLFFLEYVLWVLAFFS